MSQSSNCITVPADRGQCQTIDLAGKIAQIDGHWQPRVVAEMNDYQFKVVKVEGEFQWHRHAETDETFIVLEGELRIDFRAGPTAAVRSCCVQGRWRWCRRASNISPVQTQKSSCC
jgi:mannose-6-phosphate isomerase-like protein (cupin superfamily)